MVRQSRHIIIEGMDGSGKSTLIEHLMMTVPNLELVRNAKGPDQDLDVWWPEQLDRQDDGFVPLHDRFFYSELVYGPILRGSIKASPTLVRNALWFLRTSALLIYARPRVDKLAVGVLDKPQMVGVLEHFNDLLELYDRTMMDEQSWYGRRFYRYDWQVPGAQEAVRKLVLGYLAGNLDRDSASTNSSHPGAALE